MELAIQLFGYLILTFIGVVIPFFVVLLSIFHEGISKLIAQYKQEKLLTEENLKIQLKKLAETEKTDVKKIEQSIEQLKINEKTAKRKLSYLEPKKQIIQLFIILLLAFIGILLTLITKTNIYGIPIFFVISVVLFFLAIYLLGRLLCVLIEVKEIIARDKKEMLNKIIELLSKTAKGSQYFLQKAYININNTNIDNDDKEFNLEINSKNYLNISINNSERRMAKNVEIGFVFPSDFIIDKTGNYSTYTDENGDQIVRYYTSAIQGNTKLLLKPLVVTPITEGSFQIKTFIKAENIESTYRNVTFNVQEEEVPF
ncbi:MAG: hypothetical protein ACTSQJ_16790 [Promethearchaeota archaeon]